MGKRQKRGVRRKIKGKEIGVKESAGCLTRVGWPWFSVYITSIFRKIRRSP